VENSAPIAAKPNLPVKPTATETRDRLIALLKNGSRTYKQLRALGFDFTDAEFDAFIKAHSTAFLMVRVIRHDESGKRILPGWPAAMLNFNPAVAKITDPAVRAQLSGALRSSGHSFKYLRAIGYNYPDEDFAALVAEYPKQFRATRVIRRDENGKRIIPGWPALVSLQKKENIKK
jgi:hypothetical protein